MGVAHVALAASSLLSLPSGLKAGESGTQLDAASQSPPQVQQAQSPVATTIVQQGSVPAGRLKVVCEFAAREGQVISFRECVSAREANFRQKDQQLVISEM